MLLLAEPEADPVAGFEEDTRYDGLERRPHRAATGHPSQAKSFFDRIVARDARAAVRRADAGPFSCHSAWYWTPVTTDGS